jgi:hypothetical protein
LSFLCPDPYTGGRTFAVQGKSIFKVCAKRKTARCWEDRNTREDFNRFIERRLGCCSLSELLPTRIPSSYLR